MLNEYVLVVAHGTCRLPLLSRASRHDMFEDGRE